MALEEHPTIFAVTSNIDGVFCNRTTDSNGEAKLNIKL